MLPAVTFQDTLCSEPLLSLSENLIERTLTGCQVDLLALSGLH